MMASVTITFFSLLAAALSPEIIFREGDWVYSRDNSEAKIGNVGVVKTVVGPDTVLLQYPDKKNELVNCTSLSKLFHWGEPLHAGDVVKLKYPLPDKDRSSLQDPSRTEGTVISIDKSTAAILVGFTESQEPFTFNPAALERLSSGFSAGDWFRFCKAWSTDATKSSVQKHSSVGIVHKIERDGKLKVATLGCKHLLKCSPSYLVKIKPFHVGQFIRVRGDVLSPRFQWPLKKNRCWDTGKIVKIMPNGTLLVMFPGHVWNWDEWLADPEEVEIVQLKDCNSLLTKYRHLESMHWSIRPIVFMVGLLAALRLGTVIIHAFPRLHRGKKRVAVDSTDDSIQFQLVDTEGIEDSKNVGNSVWLPPSVANVWFKDGVTAIQ